MGVVMPRGATRNPAAWQGCRLSAATDPQQDQGQATKAATSWAALLRMMVFTYTSPLPYHAPGGLTTARPPIHAIPHATVYELSTQSERKHITKT